MERITRFEIDKGEVFVNIEIHDELGMYNYGRWLPMEVAEQIKADFASKKESETKYKARLKSPLMDWVNTARIEARQTKEFELANPVEEIVEEAEKEINKDKIIQFPKKVEGEK